MVKAWDAAGVPLALAGAEAAPWDRPSEPADEACGFPVIYGLWSRRGWLRLAPGRDGGGLVGTFITVADDAGERFRAIVVECGADGRVHFTSHGGPLP